MQVIIICGPSGSGKTTISEKLLKVLKNGIILNTDNYYKTGLISKILSKIIPSYFDREISFNKKLFYKDLNFIQENGYIKHFYKYNFKKKYTIKFSKEKKKINFLIIEGIFGKYLQRKFIGKSCILIKLKTPKRICMKRVIKRDYIERGKSKKVAEIDFYKAWKIYKKNNTNNLKHFCNMIVIKKSYDLNKVIKKITDISK